MTEDARGVPLEVGDTVIYSRSGVDRFMALATVVSFETSTRVEIKIKDVFITPLGFSPIHLGAVTVANDEDGKLGLRGETANTRSVNLVKIDTLPHSSRKNAVNI